MSKKMRDFFNPKPPTGMQKVLEEHRMTDEMVGGFLRKCSCGEAVDWDTEHWAKMLAKEGFGDLTPARELVALWTQRSIDLHDKAMHMSGTGQTGFRIQSMLSRSTALRYLSSKLKEALDNE